ncbi:nicotinamide mononucleotide transporter [Flavobacterium psychrophilum]|jgi:nicotinamide mononucleotide transporter|uniref:Nicotinamide riboside transporter PnuC n=2 Tax=Flavobacterium psychrophilum TaxID=96345 RepID=A0A7U2NFY9_FLAPS|nr:nicotinamide riboside transporter PnuC [Flavobacterium psychrophilum]EKT2070357.1 nicotinamide mononucleotide transporter [Flavobacterium psychrophilum]EKT2072268.1 nicotinamide mononucleotide transporter [Flavobacterium psychrophilum]EKT3958010.1 nicotinamide mononucleotide transporter [Flavobacterium psychrophilum]EKT3964324.1 nicotinamide mononucleotide transporter [Flavobacterium psychrophilum]EKT3965734.1 nicotinamide mononucleotide transporter [Flavobacterium psychrophilum]
MIESLFSQYKNYPTYEIVLELVAIFFGLSSVWCAKKNNIWVFPTGLISTFIYAYLLWQWDLLGDSMINGYYFIMSIYGWYHWTRKKEDAQEFPISVITNKEKIIGLIIFVLTLIFVIIVYIYFGKFTNWYSYIDTFLTAIFFVGMWLMAKRKIENWLFWILGDLISIPLYFAKGYTFTSFQYIIFTIIAVFGYLEWKKILNSNKVTS